MFAALVGLAALSSALLIDVPAADAASSQGARAALATTYPGAAWEVASPESLGYSSAGIEAVRAYVGTIPTTGLVVVVGGRVLLQTGDTSTPTKVHSVRKSVLSMLYGKPVSTGQVNLDRTLADLQMSDLGGLLPIEQRATVRHLLSARSGVYHPAATTGDDIAFAPARGSVEPGTYFLYNNWDFNAAGAAFERMTGRDIYDALEADLAGPLGMQDFDRSLQRKSGDSSKSIYDAYHMWLSTRDMARLGHLMLRDGNWNGTQVVPAEWARATHSVVTPVGQMNPEERRTRDYGWGYLWWVKDGPNATGAYAGTYRAAGSYGQYIQVMPALDMVVAHTTSTGDTDSSQFNEIVKRLIAARTGTPTATPTSTPPATVSPTATPAPAPAPVTTRWDVSAAVSPATLQRGKTETVSVTVTPSAAATAAVRVALVDPSGKVALERWFDDQTFTAGSGKTYSVPWRVPTSAVRGTYNVRVEVFATGRTPLLQRSDVAAQFVVTR